jgi:hypothetical protein
MKFRVELERKRSASEAQNSRRRVEYVEAAVAIEASRIAAMRCREFVVVTVRAA